MSPTTTATRVPGLAIDWGSLGPIRVRAKMLADGLYAGGHRSMRRGSGIEFAGYREYTPGDDLRFLDRRAMLRHERLLIRQFETETERDVWIIVDATPSMTYRGTRALGAKLAYAGLLAAALARVVGGAGDAVSLVCMGQDAGLRRATGASAMDRMLLELERVGVDLTSADIRYRSAKGPQGSSRVHFDVEPIAASARSGSLIYCLSDFLDTPSGFLRELGQLSSRTRRVHALQILDPDEVDFPFEGSLRLRSLEGDLRIDTDASVRAAYQAELATLQANAKATMTQSGCSFDVVQTSAAPTEAFRALTSSFA
jgi:uncharacterized protein (DUF58 family)